MRPARRPRTRARAFSLLEVMVAVSILGLALTVILSAQGGLSASNKMAANMGMATTLARCKMTDIEERLLKLGYPELDEVDPQAICCEGIDAPNFTCATRIEKVQLPNPPDNSLGDGGFMAGGFGEGGILTPPVPSGAADIPGMVNPAGSSAALNLDMDAGLQNIGAQVQGQLAAMGGTQGLLNMVMGIVYPSLKPLLENSIRRLTVSVKWKEGTSDKDFTIVQYVTNPQRSGFINGIPVGDGGLAPSSSGAPNIPGAPGGGASPIPAIPGRPF